jgi:hypothetical protein
MNDGSVPWLIGVGAVAASFFFYAAISTRMASGEDWPWDPLFLSVALRRLPLGASRAILVLIGVAILTSTLVVAL